jgi:hypothetical protein
LLTIRRAQFLAFQAARDREFARWFLSDLRLRHPDIAEGASDPALLDRILASLEKGRGWGLSQPTSLALFLEATFVVGPDFDSSKHAASSLRRLDLPEEARVGLALTRVSEKS